MEAHKENTTLQPMPVPETGFNITVDIIQTVSMLVGSVLIFHLGNKGLKALEKKFARERKQFDAEMRDFFKSISNPNRNDH